ncbi:hypothetical protein EST38_g3600 [Candolleomyces aberdarensis]|uniref:Uncharacterized protein n=1 Tax=Candolleomyces aberdarensis TaxID=2316362 RepID=A0A4V1Q4I8_9AGAR|nr:hypothetical protein EST38_g3600 [Candolleomyces aberdarensis]
MGSKQRRIFDELWQDTSTSHADGLDTDSGAFAGHHVDNLDHLTDETPLEHVADMVFDAIYEP